MLVSTNVTCSPSPSPGLFPVKCTVSFLLLYCCVELVCCCTFLLLYVCMCRFNPNSFIGWWWVCTCSCSVCFLLYLLTIFFSQHNLIFTVHCHSQAPKITLIITHICLFVCLFVLMCVSYAFRYAPFVVIVVMAIKCGHLW